MRVVLFTYGNNTFINKDNCGFLQFPSFLLFQEPKLFTIRFQEIIQNKLQISDFSEISEILLFLPGKIDSIRGIILTSDELNNFSLNGFYDGFNVKKALSTILKTKSINVYSILAGLTLGAGEQYGEEESIMLINLGSTVEIGFAHNKYNILLPRWSNDLVGLNGLHILMLNKTNDIFQKYNEFLQMFIINVSARYERLNNKKIKKILILGEYSNLVNKSMLNDLPICEDNIDINTDDEIEKYLTKASNNYLATKVLIDNLSISDIKSKNLSLSGYKLLLLFLNPVVKVEYYIGNKLILNIQNFEEWEQHYLYLRPFATGNNYYVLTFFKSLKTILYFHEIKTKYDLKEFFFIPSSIEELYKEKSDVIARLFSF